MSRFAKQLVFGFIYLILILLIGYGIYYFRQSTPSCVDGIQNQNEEGVDCGLVCGNSCKKILPIDVSSVQVFKVGRDDYDILAKVYNPNSDLGSSKVVFDLILVDKDSAELSRRNFEFYILPGQIKHIILTSVKSTAEVQGAKIVIKDISWEKLSLFDPQMVSFIVRDKQFKQTEFGAIVRNESDFDFDTVDIGVILYDQNDNVIGLNKSNMNTLVSRTDRYFKVLWPIPIMGVFKVDVEPGTNLLNNLNFIRRYGTQEKFQEYY